MRIAFVSDLHAEHREASTTPPYNYTNIWGGIHFPLAMDADCLVIAGDVHPNINVRRRIADVLEQKFNIPVIMVEGNHDYWGSHFPLDQTISTYEIEGIRIAATPLWTHLTPIDEMRAKHFVDFQNIKGLTPAIWNFAHRRQLGFLKQSEAQVIVTHHAPSYASVSARFKGSPINCFFVNNLDLGLFPDCKVWIHGHVHSHFDYVQQSVRVMCNPYGYPHEFGGAIKLRYVEV